MEASNADNPPDEADESMDEDESMSDDDSSDYSDEDSVDSGYGNLLQNALFPPNSSPPVDTRTPLERWNDYLTKIRTQQTKVLKFVDVQLQGELSVMATFASSSNENNGEEGEGAPPWKTELLEAITTAAVNPEDSTTTGYLTHAILGSEILRLLGPEGQKQLFVAIASHSTLAFLQLKGIQDVHPNTHDNRPTVLSMPALIEALNVYDTPSLSEMELLGVKFPTTDSVKQWSAALERRRGSLRQVNLVGIEPPTIITAGQEDGGIVQSLSPGWLDPILLALPISSANMATPLDELKLITRHSPTTNHPITPAITPTALSALLLHKKKWWRLSLDGLGLQDEHLHVLTTMFRRDDTCKAGDLLSLERNPGISSRAYQEFFEGCFFWKRRMGLIKVDDKDWEAQFDLVRSMNNLHNRLDYVVSQQQQQQQQHRSPKCSYASRDKWVEWLAKLGSGLAWEDDKHRINYLWFTLLEKPEFIYSHE